jgi:hypothetical protein
MEDWMMDEFPSEKNNSDESLFYFYIMYSAQVITFQDSITTMHS